MSDYISREAALRDWPLCDEPGDAYQFIRNFPAADVRPVRHGRWTHGEGDSRWMCSVCKGIENTRLVSKCSACGYQTIDPRNYCPNCGADMREES